MKTVLLLAVVALLSGCVGRMTNDMIIAEAMKCEQAGLPWRQVFNYDGTVNQVFCSPYIMSRERQDQARSPYR
jgi:hypothetical protein